MKTTTLTTAALLAICTGVTSLPARATDASALLQLAPICNGLYQGVLTTIRGPAGPNTNLKSMYTWQLNRCAVAGNTNAQAAGIIAPNGTLYAFTSELGAAIANDLTHLTSKSHVTFCPVGDADITHCILQIQKATAVCTDGPQCNTLSATVNVTFSAVNSAGEATVAPPFPFDQGASCTAIFKRVK